VNRVLICCVAITFGIFTRCSDESGGTAAISEATEWFRADKFGMFIHWGLYAIPAGTWGESVHEEGYSEWIMYHERIPVHEYEELASRFNPSQFNARDWVRIAKEAGMKYMVITTKHHDGFSMFNSGITEYDIVDATPYKRDVIKELAAECRKEGINFGCYYSIDRDWHHPLCSSNRHQQDNFWDYPDSSKKDFNKYLYEFAIPQVKELLVKYHPDIMWFDGIEMKSDAQIEEIYHMIKEVQPGCLVNSRLKTYTPPDTLPLQYADYLSMDDNQVPDEVIGFGWENPGTMNTSYGYNSNDYNWMSSKQLIVNLVDIVSKGGNYLLNVGPTDEGLIPGPSTDRLAEIGEWMHINSEAIYGTTPWNVFGEGPILDLALAEDEEVEEWDEIREKEYTFEDIRFTTKDHCVYAICLNWPEETLLIKSFSDIEFIKRVSLLGSDNEVDWELQADGLSIGIPSEKPCKYAFTFKVELE
jgi:alpha-L-fucosidase